jgi:hypothetical protein
MGKQADAYPATQNYAGGDMSMRLNSAIVLDYRSAVDNAVFADYRTGIDDDSGHHYGPPSDACRRSNDGGGVNKSR